MNTLIIYGFTAGAVATVNPCGIALLPAWFARQMAAYADRSPGEKLVRATLAGGLVSCGFITTFLIAAAIFASGAMWLGAAIPWLGITLGLALTLVGAAWLFAVRLPGVPVVEKCRRVNARFGAFGFGVSYGIASISCTLPVFMSVAGLSFLEVGDVSFAGIIAYLAGAACVLTLTSVLGSTAGSGLQNMVQGKAGLLRRVAGGLTLLAGLYVTLYWGRLFLENVGWADEITYLVGSWGARASGFFTTGYGIFILALGTLVVATIAWIAHRAGMTGAPNRRETN